MSQSITDSTGQKVNDQPLGATYKVLKNSYNADDQNVILQSVSVANLGAADADSFKARLSALEVQDMYIHTDLSQIIAIGSSQHLRGEFYQQGKDAVLYNTQGKGETLKPTGQFSLLEITDFKPNFTFTLTSDGNQYDVNKIALDMAKELGANPNAIALRIKPEDSNIKSIDLRSVEGWPRKNGEAYPSLAHVGETQKRFPTAKPPQNTYGIVGFIATPEGIAPGQVVQTIHTHAGAARAAIPQGGHVNEITFGKGTTVEIMYASDFAIADVNQRGVWNSLVTPQQKHVLDNLVGDLELPNGFVGANLPLKKELGAKHEVRTTLKQNIK